MRTLVGTSSELPGRVRTSGVSANRLAPRRAGAVSPPHTPPEQIMSPLPLPRPSRPPRRSGPRRALAPKRPGRVLLAAAVLAATVVTGSVVVATSARAATGCRVAYTVTNQWQGGFGASVTITNLGDPLNGWTLTWS